jgi:hypothetical protein
VFATRGDAQRRAVWQRGGMVFKSLNEFGVFTIRFDRMYLAKFDELISLERMEGWRIK